MWSKDEHEVKGPSKKIKRDSDNDTIKLSDDEKE